MEFCGYFYKSLGFIKYVSFYHLDNSKVLKEDEATWGELTCKYSDVEEGEYSRSKFPYSWTGRVLQSLT